MAKRNNKPEQAPVNGSDNENTATPVDETTAVIVNEEGTTTEVNNNTKVNELADENNNAPVDENADTNVAENNSANGLGENTATTEPTSAEALAAEAFAQHNHVSKVWVDELKGEWHLVKRHGLKEFNRP